MRIRSVSLLATTLAALLGCPLEGMQASPSDESATSERDRDGLAFENSEAHDDAVDAPDDVSWVQRGELGAGTGALRVLMTDAPVEADNVFVTLCGIHVEPKMGEGDDDAARGDAARPEPGRDDGMDREPPGDMPRGSGEDEPRETAPADRDGDESDDDESDNTPADSAMADAEAEELTEEERIEAERERIEAERDEGDDEVAPERTPDDPRDESDEGDDGHDPSSGAEPPPGAPRGWYSVSDECQTVDLLSLRNGVTEAMGLTTLPAGRYGRIHLTLTEATLVKDGLRQDLELPAGESGGVQVIGGFSVQDGEATTLTLDFDAGESIVYAPGRGFILRPVIRLVDVTQHGPEGDDPPSNTGEGSERPRGEQTEGASGRDAPPPPPERQPPAPGADRPREGAPGTRPRSEGSGGAGGSGGSAGTAGRAGSSA